MSLPDDIASFAITSLKTSRVLQPYHVEFKERVILPGRVGNIVYIIDKYGLEKGSKLKFVVRENAGDRHINYSVAYQTM